VLLAVFRHGIAHDRDAPDCPPDPERRLTTKGVERTREAARGLVHLEVSPRVVFTSPYARARETAEILADTVTPRAEVVVKNALLPARNPSELLDLLRDVDEDEVACCGHAPHLDDLIAEALGSTIAFTHLKKAGAALLELDPGSRGTGSLRWLLTARTLRDLGAHRDG